jgi:hypothetical protein
MRAIEASILAFCAALKFLSRRRAQPLETLLVDGDARGADALERCSWRVGRPKRLR